MDEELTREQREAAQADLLRFTALNALSFEILAGQILILFARQVGASLSDIGLLAGLLPFASIIQLGVAPLVNRFGPRLVMLVGWGARTFVAAGLFLVPGAIARGGTTGGTQVLLAIMAGFYLCRALGMSSWLPMVQEIVPPQDRGVYLSRQEWLRQVSIVLIAVVTALYLMNAQDLTRFMHVMGVGVAAAAWSLYFLWRVPDVGIAPEPSDGEYLHRATAPLRDEVFRRYLAFSCALRMVLSAFTPFLVVYLREGLHLPASGVIAINTVSSLGAIATLGAWGRWTDRFGAKPVLGASIGGLSAALLLWLLPGNDPAWHWVGVPIIALVLGAVTGGVTVSMSKFELGFTPIEGRAHYVAINVTAVGLTSGIATLAAGQLLEVLRGHDVRVLWMVLDQYRLFFLVSAVLLVLPFFIRRGLPEQRARSVRTFLRVGILREGLRHAARWRSR
jgi:Na+/melibiose symporter-like transporter